MSNRLQDEHNLRLPAATATIVSPPISAPALSQEESDRQLALRLSQEDGYMSALERGVPVHSVRLEDHHFLPPHVHTRPPPRPSADGPPPELISDLSYVLRNNAPHLLGAGHPEQTADWTVARHMQALELELAGDFRHYDFKEHNASVCRNQLFTMSTAIGLAQIIVFIIEMFYGPHIATLKENPMYGPTTLTLIQMGAKVAALIVYRQQWWRLFVPIFLHAGVL